jgi:DUF4097 and DUF4098 domain-containing protein YvlB
MIRLASRIAILVSVLLAVVWAAPGYALDKEFNQTYTLHSGATVELQNVNGTIQVQGWDRNEVEVHAVKTTKHRESDLDRVSIEVESTPQALSILTRYPQDEGVEVTVEYTLRVPHGARLEHIGTVNGTLHVSGVDAVGELHTVNGNIEVFEAGGAIRARTTNGNIHLELAHLQSPAGATLETTNGSLEVALPPETQANIEARCLNGTFFSELPVAMQSTHRLREVRGQLGQGGAPLHMRTVNGGIRVLILRSTI